MRKREEIERWCSASVNNNVKIDVLILEVLLDIRELLIEHN